MSRFFFPLFRYLKSYDWNKNVIILTIWWMEVRSHTLSAGNCYNFFYCYVIVVGRYTFLVSNDLVFFMWVIKKTCTWLSVCNQQRSSTTVDMECEKQAKWLFFFLLYYTKIVSVDEYLNCTRLYLVSFGLNFIENIPLNKFLSLNWSLVSYSS